METVQVLKDSCPYKRRKMVPESFQTTSFVRTCLLTQADVLCQCKNMQSETHFPFRPFAFFVFCIGPLQPNTELPKKKKGGGVNSTMLIQLVRFDCNLPPLFIRYI